MSYRFIVIRRFLILTFAAASIAVWSIGPAIANSLSLTLTAGSHTYSATDGGSGWISVPFGTVVGNWTIDTLDAWSYPVLTDANNDDYVQLFCPAVVGTDSTPLTVTATETGFSPFPTANTFNMVLNTQNTATQTGFINGTLIGTLGPSATALTASLPVSGQASTFTMTDTLVIQPTSLGTTNGEIELLSAAPVPEPTSLALLGTALLVLSPELFETRSPRFCET